MCKYLYIAVYVCVLLVYFDFYVCSADCNFCWNMEKALSNALYKEMQLVFKIFQTLLVNQRPGEKLRNSVEKLVQAWES